ncbi:MAG: hypothetical protein MZV64_70170 [Ignavibacteriales bacterium]|nr:hypothetical protein [Ignavibacteriales bacterium]
MNTRLKILFAFFIFLFSQHTLFSQTPVSGVINKYTKVISINNSKDTLLVTDATLFSNGDTVMVMQMRGAKGRNYSTTNEELGGSVSSTGIKKAGKYEIIIVKKVLTAQNKIVLRNPLAKLYDTNKKVQLISVPIFQAPAVASTLTCDPWDGDKGGVLVIMVADTLVLNANIDVSGKGFRGAEPVLSTGACASSDSLLYRSYFFDEVFTGAGRKGEGIADDTVTYVKGLGRWANAGGGGNARFSGGGGGGGAGDGGGGGAEDSTTCNTPNYIGEIIPGPDTLDWIGIGGRGGQGLKNPNFLPILQYFLAAVEVQEPISVD